MIRDPIVVDHELDNEVLAMALAQAKECEYRADGLGWKWEEVKWG